MILKAVKKIILNLQFFLMSLHTNLVFESSKIKYKKINIFIHT